MFLDVFFVLLIDGCIYEEGVDGGCWLVDGYGDGCFGVVKIKVGV